MVVGNENGLSAADIAAIIGNNDGTGGGNGLWWLIILVLFAFSGNGFGNFGGNGGAMPFVMGNAANADMQRGFDQQAVMTGLNGIATTVQNGFATAEVGRANSVATILQAMTSNSNLTNQALQQLAMSLQQCCCDNRAAVADLKYTTSAENCSTRQVVSDAARDIQAQAAANTNTILNTMNERYQGLQDKLCQLELDGVKQRYETQITGLGTQITQLQAELAASRAAASQTAQTADLKQYVNQMLARYVGDNNGCGGCGSFAS